jgi:hypothetical protein
MWSSSAAVAGCSLKRQRGLSLDALDIEQELIEAIDEVNKPKPQCGRSTC